MTLLAVPLADTFAWQKASCPLRTLAVLHPRIHVSCCTLGQHVSPLDTCVTPATCHTWARSVQLPAVPVSAVCVPQRSAQGSSVTSLEPTAPPRSLPLVSSCTANMPCSVSPATLPSWLKAQPEMYILNRSIKKQAWAGGTCTSRMPVRCCGRRPGCCRLQRSAATLSAVSLSECIKAAYRLLLSYLPGTHAVDAHGLVQYCR